MAIAHDGAMGCTAHLCEHTYVEVYPSNLVEVIQFLITILCGRGEFDKTALSVR